MEAANPLMTRVSEAEAQGHSDAMRWIWYIALALLAILLTTFHYLSTTSWWLASPERMADFGAAAPFQYRVLLPVVVAGVTNLAPWVDVELLFAFIEVGAWMLLVVIAHRTLVHFQVGGSDLVRRLLAMTIVVPMAMHLIVPDMYFHSVFTIRGGVVELGKWQLVALFRYVYDLPAAVLTLTLVLLLARFVESPDRRSFAAYLGIFAIATLNRETTVFMIPAFLAACWGAVGRRNLAMAIVAQVIVFAAIHGAVKWFFPGIPNPHANVMGTAYENHLLYNLGLFASPLYLLTYLARFGAGLYLPVMLLRRHLDPTLGRTLICFGLPFLATAVYFGRLPEQRVVAEIVPILWLGAVQAIAAWSRTQRVSEAEPAAVHRLADAAARQSVAPKRTMAGIH